MQNCEHWATAIGLPPKLGRMIPRDIQRRRLMAGFHHLGEKKKRKFSDCMFQHVHLHLLHCKENRKSTKKEFCPSFLSRSTDRKPWRSLTEHICSCLAWNKGIHLAVTKPHLDFCSTVQANTLFLCLFSPCLITSVHKYYCSLLLFCSILCWDHCLWLPVLWILTNCPLAKQHALQNVLGDLFLATCKCLQ